MGEFRDKNVQDNYTNFLGHFNKVCELHIPKGEIKPRVKWLTRGMKSNMRIFSRILIHA